MTSKKPYYTSESLIDAVRRRCSLPKADSMFSDQDLLDFANDEMMEGILPMIKSSHEEYFVWSELVNIESDDQSYEIPERAIGNGLRDLSYVDQTGIEYEMTRINRDMRFDRYPSKTASTPLAYYVENSSIILVPAPSSTSGALKMIYLLRPNNLVLSERVSKIESSTEAFVLVNSITIGSTTTFVTNTPHFLTTGEEVEIDSITGTGASLLNTTLTVTVVDDATFTVDVDTTGQGPFSGGRVFNNTTQINVDNLLDEITLDTSVDFLKSKSPHNTLAIDIFPKEINYITKFLVFKTTDLPIYSVGDTIALSYETNIPGIPTELHRLLISKVCERVLEAQGDQAGRALASEKSQRSEIASGTLIENRVTSAPLKVVNRHGFISSRRRRRF